MSTGNTTPAGAQAQKKVTGKDALASDPNQNNDLPSPSPQQGAQTLDGVELRLDVPPFAKGGAGWMMSGAAEDYLAEYVFSPDEGSDHKPSEWERVLLNDFMNGLLADERFFWVVRHLLDQAEAAKARAAALAEALKPFAAEAENQSERELWENPEQVSFTISDLRRARQALGARDDALTPREVALFDAAWNLVVAVNGGGPLPHKTVAERAEEATAVLIPLLDARNAALSAPARTERGEDLCAGRTQERPSPSLAGRVCEPSSVATCASCIHMGRIYHRGIGDPMHFCGKSNQRRAETMRPTGDFAEDFMRNFRTFFDAEAGQRACRHYHGRPVLSADKLSVLLSVKAAQDNGEHRASFKFLTPECSLAEEMDDRFLERCDWRVERGHKGWRLTPLGKAELARAATLAGSRHPVTSDGEVQRSGTTEPTTSGAPS